MAVVSFSVGSFGDIVTILQLAWQLRAALNSASGASAEVAALVNDIDEFVRGLQQVNAVLQQDAARLQPDIVNGIKHALGTCHDVLLTVERKISTFKSRMSTTKGPSVWKHYWAVAAWSILGGKEDVDALRARLSEQLARIHFYLSLGHSHDHSTMQAHASASEERLDKIYALLQALPSQVTVPSPSFKLFDPESKRYYQPCAPTSYQRLRELVMAANKHVNPALEFGLQKDVYRYRHVFPDPDVAHILYIGAAKMGTQDEDFPDSVRLGSSVWAPAVPVQCFFFQGVFNEWQVMLGAPLRSATVEYQQLLKVILERKHAIGAPCDCDGAHCRVRFAGLRERAAYLKQALLAYSEAGTLLLSHVPEDEDGSYWRERILAALKAYPDPKYVMDTILPFLWEIDAGQSAWVEETDREQGETKASGEIEGDTTCRDIEPQGYEAIDDATAIKDEEPPTEENSASELEGGYYSLDEMVSWLENAPSMREIPERLDFNFIIQDLRTHSRVVAECKDIAFQIMLFL